jgi:sigma-B regulation protein RsbU (phosphoserine phosphatase)
MADIQHDFNDFLEHALCGFLTINTKGEILEANSRICRWIGCNAHDLKGKRFSDLLSIGGKIYYETHLWPLLRMQGYFDEVALELSCQNKERLPVLLNAYERRDENGAPLFVRLTIFKATDRRQYEQNLRNQKQMAEESLSSEKTVSALREQFIAVLGHDLRNPLSSVVTGASLLSVIVQDEQQKKIVATMQNSARRMAGMIEDIMDFARGRLGGGMQVNRQPTQTEPVLLHVVNELRTSYPDRIIETDFNITEPVNCDAPRMAQLLSNLLANALAHGSHDATVDVRAFHKEGLFELSVSNSGKPIPAASLERLFHPFTREGNRPSQNGLGLGLYIASQIALAHQGELSVASDEQETRFTFRMPPVA